MFTRLITSLMFVISIQLSPLAIADSGNTYPHQLQGVPWPTEFWPKVDGSEPYSRKDIEDDIRSFLIEGDAEFFRGGRGVVVIHQGKLVAEFYRESEGYGPQSRFISWSQAKSITQALVGIGIREKLLAVSEPVGFEEWKGTEKAEITLEHLLRMSAGLEFVEGMAGLDDNSRMMFGVGHTDMAGYAGSLPLIYKPGSHWAYATGTTMIVSRVIREAVGGTTSAYFDFMHKELLDPIGMKSAVPEFDQAGTFLGGAFFYATTRDYAKFGLLYLRDGIWDGKRILPEGWVDYTRSETKGSDGNYGVHIWLNPLGGHEKLNAKGLSLPDDMFQARGMGGQFIAIIPSLDLVIAYNGYTEARDYSPIDTLFATIAQHFD